MEGQPVRGGDPLDGTYVDDPEGWTLLAQRLRAAGAFGLDTEFYGVELDEQSVVGRGVVHVWSVAIRTERMDPRGFHRCRGWVLHAAALQHLGLRAVLEDRAVRKAVHNEPVDSHALANGGVRLRGAVNTLGLIRWQRPDLVNQKGRFALKPLMFTLLGREPVCTFKQLVGWERMVPYSTFRKEERSVCSCGAPGCRLRKGHAKHKEVVQVETVRERKEVGAYPLQEIIPGHARWELLVAYALDDAVAALQVEEIAVDTPNPAPWPYAVEGCGERPGHSQAAEEEVIRMEACGFPVDVPFCTVTAAIATEDEERELVWLHRWYVANAPTHGPHRREDSDPIWSSPTQKVALFDELGFPRSPIWKKGRVKRGDVKMDGTAMEWIAKNHKPARQLLGHLLQLQRIRSGKKYLVKLRDSGGWVHPICGPAGDEDDRAGAVTGRLGIKGELEAQQLPKEGEKDLYQIRKAIIA